MIMNENMLNMLKELDSEFPDNYGLREGLRIDAIDLRNRYDDDDIDFDEELLDEVRIYYKNKTILIKRYDRDDWEIKDEDYLRFVDFEKIGKILSIVMKHLGRIEFI
nr:MAG TPA: hypothetical protein [Caudoviricetes sp.]